MTQVTALEMSMIKKIARCEYSVVNGSIPNTLDDIGWVWANVIIEDSEDKGVFTSLKKKGLAVHSGNKGRDACVTLTQEGFKVFQTLV